MSYVAEPYFEVAEQLLTGLTGGVARETHRFFPAANTFRFEHEDAVAETVSVIGQANGAFHAFAQGIDFAVSETGELAFLAAEDDPLSPAQRASLARRGHRVLRLLLPGERRSAHHRPQRRQRRAHARRGFRARARGAAQAARARVRLGVHRHGRGQRSRSRRRAACDCPKAPRLRERQGALLSRYTGVRRYLHPRRHARVDGARSAGVVRHDRGESAAARPARGRGRYPRRGARRGGRGRREDHHHHRSRHSGHQRRRECRADGVRRRGRDRCGTARADPESHRARGTSPRRMP